MAAALEGKPPQRASTSSLKKLYHEVIWGRPVRRKKKSFAPLPSEGGGLRGGGGGLSRGSSEEIRGRAARLLRDEGEMLSLLFWSRRAGGGDRKQAARKEDELGEIHLERAYGKAKSLRQGKGRADFETKGRENGGFSRMKGGPSRCERRKEGTAALVPAKKKGLAEPSQGGAKEDLDPRPLRGSCFQSARD